MGLRISNYGRGHRPWPWFYKGADITAATAAAEYLLGPLPLHAVTEILFRVKTMRLEASIAWDAGGGAAGTDSLDVSMPRVFSGSGTDEDKILLEAADAGQAAVFSLWPSEVVLMSSFSSYNDFIYRDENGAFWLCPTGVIETLVPYGGQEYRFFLGDGYAGTFEVATANLVISAGTFPITARMLKYDPGPGWEITDGEYVTASSLTLTATEWYPYATATGDAAWNTATGAPANGGPGA